MLGLAVFGQGCYEAAHVGRVCQFRTYMVAILGDDPLRDTSLGAME